MRGCLILHDVESKPDVEVRCFPRCRPEPDQMEGAFGVVEQLLHKGRAHPGTAIRFSDIEMP